VQVEIDILFVLSGWAITEIVPEFYSGGSCHFGSEELGQGGPKFRWDHVDD